VLRIRVFCPLIKAKGRPDPNLSVHDDGEALRELALAVVELAADANEGVGRGAPVVVSELVELAQRRFRGHHSERRVNTNENSQPCTKSKCK